VAKLHVHVAGIKPLMFIFFSEIVENYKKISEKLYPCIFIYFFISIESDSNVYNFHVYNSVLCNVYVLIDTDRH
jgi:hypothetical protein